ncbi:MAG: hypothetical protein E6Q98_24655 [Rhodospirillaceae bacterium]|nr:MAG: hypothetical protein E6Q98_24655 [Rhodospirillaceae bacterium]
MLDDFRTLVNDMIRDNVERVTADQLDRAIGRAVIQYGKDKPRAVVEDIVSPGGKVLDFPDGAIRVIGIEYPVAEMPASRLRSDQWSVYEAPAGKQIVLDIATQAASYVRLTVTRRHLLSDDDDTIPDTDQEAVASYAAAILFDQISADTSGDGSPTIAADAVNHQAKPDNFAKRAERLRQRYYDLLGIDPKRVQAASVNVTVPMASTTGGPRLLHHRRRPR